MSPRKRLDLLYHVARQSLFYRQPFHHRLPGWCICRIPAAGAVSGAAHRPAQLPPGEGHQRPDFTKRARRRGRRRIRRHQVHAAQSDALRHRAAAHHRGPAPRRGAGSAAPSSCWGRRWTGTARAASWKPLACVSAAMHISPYWPRRTWTAPFSWIPISRWKTTFPWPGSCCRTWGRAVRRKRGLPVSGPGPRTGRIPAFAAFRRE